MRTRSVLIAMVMAVLAVVVANEALAATRHTVRQGDTLTKIAGQLGVSVKALAAANGINDPNFIVAGRLLVIPDTKTANITTGGVGTGNVHTGYVVRKGDTLVGIAAHLGVRVTDLTQANQIANPNRLTVGQVLTVPGGWRCPVAGPARFVDDFSYVKPGATTIHGGIDLFAPKGTPVLAPVSGRATRFPNPKGGQAVQLVGDDGNRYYSAHLDRYGATGRVAAGTVIGYVGNTGNAHTTSPHLHFEIHPGGGDTVNPYPTLVAACR